MADVVAERYAEALFDLAREKNLLERTEEDAHFVRSLLAKHPELYRYLQLPDVTIERKQESMDRILRESVAHPMAGLIRLMIQKARIPYLDAVLERYLELLMAYRKQIRVQITSAAPLSGEESARILRALETALQKKVLPETQVDPSLIGGLIVRVGDVVYDNSIRSSMERLTRHLTDLRVAVDEKGGVAQA